MKIRQPLFVSATAVIFAGVVGGVVGMTLMREGEPPMQPPQEVRIVQETAGATPEPSAPPAPTPSPEPAPSPTRTLPPTPKPVCTDGAVPDRNGCTTRPPATSSPHPSIRPTRGD